DAVRRLAAELRQHDVAVKLDDREGLTPGRKFNEWEQKGVPFRVELGQRDLEAGVATVVDRLSGEQAAAPLAEVAPGMPARLAAFHAARYRRAEAFRDAHTFHAETFDDLVEKVEHGFVYATHWGAPESEKD